MKKALALIFAIAAFLVFLVFISFIKLPVKQNSATNKQTQATPGETKTETTNTSAYPQVVAEGLNVPWAIVFLSNSTNDILVTERTGDLIEIKNGTKTTIKTFPIHTGNNGEGGLLGLALGPNFSNNKQIYVYYTYEANQVTSLNRVVRYKFDGGKLTGEKILVDNIPASTFHDGGRIKFGPDGFLYITVGDGEQPSRAQDKTSLSGKILRITTDGNAAPGNPFGTLIYSYGHRNPQGLAWDNSGKLWETEHGRSTPTGFDELNIIEPGKNYGWPTIQGDQGKDGMVTPVINSGPTTTWAPAGIIYLNGSLFFGGLKGAALFEYNIAGKQLTKHFENQFGRIRDVELGPDKMIYITTSNRDGRGTPKANDDKIIKINPSKLN